MATRNESVRLSLQDDFTSGMARATAATAILKRELNDLDGITVSARRNIGPLGNDIDRLGTSSGRSGKEIDKLSGRLRLAADAAAILGPALIPLGTLAVGGIVAVSAQLGALATGLGVTLLATNGLADGLDALNKYQLDPSAANAEKLRHQLDLLGSSGQRFVYFLDSITPELQSLQFAARDGLLPGAEEGIQHLLTLLPQLRSLITDFSTEVGSLAADAGEALSGDKFRGFFDYLQSEGVPILDEAARTIGNLTEAAANLFVAFAPLTGDISGGLLEFSEGLAEASRRLGSDQGFQEFLDYVRTTGPVALETLESIANAFLQIVEAAAPLGGPALKALGQVADAIARIADSDLGTPIFGALAALALLNRSLVLTEKLTASTFGGPAVAKMKGYVAGLTEVTTAQQRAQMSATELDAANAKTYGAFAKGAGQIGLVAASLSGVADSAGLADTAMLGLLGPWGAAAGLALDLKSAWDGLNDSLASNKAALASDDIAALEARIAATKKALEDLQSTSKGEAFGKSVLSGVGLGVFTDAQDQIGAATGKTRELSDQLAEMEARLAGLKSGAVETFNPVERFGAALSKAALAAQREASALQDAVDAMRAKRQESLRALNAEINYQAAIDDANQAIKDNGKNFDITTEKGRANRQALYELADGWNQQSNAAKNAKGSLEAARKNFVDTARDMGATAAQAKNLADRLFEIPPKRKTEITVEDGQALAALNAVRDFHIPDKIVQVRVQSHGLTSGGPLGDQQYDTGGYTGNIPTRDIAGIVHGREVVLPADVAARDAAHLKSRYGYLPNMHMLRGYAGGGMVTDTYTSRHAAGQGDNAVPAIQFFVAGVQSATKYLKALKDELEKSKDALDKQRQKVDDITSAMGSLSSSVASRFDVNLGETSKTPWASGGGLQSMIDTATSQASQFPAIIAALKAAGLQGPALSEALQEMSFSQLQALAANPSGAAQLGASLSSLYAAQQVASGAAGQAVYGDQLKGAEARLDAIRAEVRHLTHVVAQADKKNQKGHKDTADAAAGVHQSFADGHRRGQRGPR